jgi:hypothetical protein
MGATSLKTETVKETGFYWGPATIVASQVGVALIFSSCHSHFFLVYSSNKVAAREEGLGTRLLQYIQSKQGSAKLMGLEHIEDTAGRTLIEMNTQINLPLH